MTYGNLSSPGMILARLLADLHQVGPKVKRLSSEQKRIARHMAREGKTAQEILTALDINMGLQTFRKRLAECRIKTCGQR